MFINWIALVQNGRNTHRILESLELSGRDVCDLLIIHNPDFRTKEEVETLFVFKFIAKNILLVRYMLRTGARRRRSLAKQVVSRF
jgi:hypothetical protein